MWAIIVFRHIPVLELVSMLFRRRTPPGIGEKFRVWIWPRRSWVRSSRYVSKRIFRLTGSPHTIAAGVAAGVFASFTPFMGLHFLIAFLVAYILAGNMIAAALGTFVGNPLTFPFIWASTFSFGRFLLQDHSPATAPFANLGQTMKHIGEATWRLDFAGISSAMAEIWHPLLKPMLAGGIPLGFALGLAFYFATRRMANFVHAARQRKLIAKAVEIHERNMNVSPKDNQASKNNMAHRT